LDIDNVPRTATVRARTACLLLVLTREDFLRVLEASPGSYTSKSACERAGYTWDSASGVCR
jgi:hypothetical protein